jgi:hypothetical protein
MSHALAIVDRLRKLAVDEARRDLAARLAAEAAAEAVEQAALAGMQCERQAARTLRVEEAGGAFAAWLPRGLQAIAAAHDASDRAATATTLSRTALTEARAARLAAQQMLAREAAARATAAARREQAVFDEIAAVRAMRPARG